MLKFQNNHTTVIAIFEDFILTVYVIIDDLYWKYAPESVSGRRHIQDAKLSDSEIITISICGELAGIDSENTWFSFVKRNYRYLFHKLCSRSRFNRTRRALLQVTELLREKLLSVFSMPCDRYFIIDSFPLSVCFITAFEITPASVDDREGLRDMVANRSNLVILGDKGYVGEALAQEMKEQGICLMSLKRSNSKVDWPKPVRQLIFRLRRRVETVFSQLSEQLNAEKVLAKSFHGLCTRLVNKILAYNLCLVLNRLFDENCEIGKIKQFIF